MLIAQRDPAIEAFHAHGKQSAAQRARIIEFIRQRGGDWSIGELAQAMGMQKSTMSARLNECLALGELIERPKRRDRISNITIRPVALPAKQGDLFA